MKKDIKRILIIRTDRIGDVLLSTPAIQALRENFPDAFISMLVRPYSEPVIRHNPYLNEIIIYDKYGKHHSFINTFLFALKLRKRNFDLALMLHPTNRVHIMAFLAGIPIRVGYDNKLKILLTHPIRHIKQFGGKHEKEYTLDMLKVLNVGKRKKYSLKLNISDKISRKIRDLLKSKGLFDKNIIAIHPGASCPSKIWPVDKYIALIKKLYNKKNTHVIVIGDKNNIEIGKYIQNKLDFDIWNTSGKFSILEVAALLKYSKLLISNDSGPVHVASAVGTPVIAIFGRKQPGLSPKRWGPTGDKDVYLHKDIGCNLCLAHNCNKKFKCIRSIKVDEVLDVFENMHLL